MMAFIFIAMFFLGKLINGSVIIFTIYDGDRARDLDLDQDQDQEREREIRELIGSIHHQCPDQKIKVKVFGYFDDIPSGLLDEITLWRGVQFVDISQQIQYTRQPKRSRESKDKEHLKLCLFEYVFEEEFADQAVYIESGRIFDSSLLLNIKEDAKGDGYEIYFKQGGYKELLNNFRGISHVTCITGTFSYDIALPKIDPKSKWSCSIIVRSELVFSGLLNRKEPVAQVDKGIALLIPTRNENDKIEDCAFVKFFIPSFKQTLKKKENVTIYLGYDVDDKLLTKPENRESLIELLDYEDEEVKIKFIEFPKTGWLTFIWNFLFVEAFADGYELFFQLNDDISFLSDDWLNTSVNMMVSGVIGLNDITWQCKLYTQTLVTRTHYTIFKGQYFPLSLRNWYSDNWITEVYGQLSRCNQDAKIKNGNVGMRYEGCDDRNYQTALQQGRSQLKRYHLL